MRKLLKPMKTAVKMSSDTPSSSTYSAVTAIPVSSFNLDLRICDMYL